MQSALTHPERFVIAHYAQPAHLVAVVEVVVVFVLDYFCSYHLLL